MNEEIENVTEEVTENTEAQAVEEIEEGIELTDTADTEEVREETETVEEKEEEKPQGRYVTDDELNEIVDKRVARKMSKIDREHQKELSKYKDTENVLRATLNVSDGEDVNQKLREVYEADGVKLPSRYEPGLSSREIELLAKGDADDIIEDGYKAAETEANRLASRGYENLNERERITFNTLVNYLNGENDKRSLLQLGAKEEILSDKSFQDFRKKFNSNVPIKEVYELYQKNQPKPKFENPGSMKNTSSSPKDFISEAEYDKMSRAEVRANMDLIEKSMAKW